MSKIIKASVRDIVEFVLKSGSIDSRFMSRAAMEEGVKIHQQLQKARKKDAAKNGYAYASEYKLQYSFTYGSFDFIVEGRADGILANSDGVFIEELKSTLTPLEDIDGDENHWHWAQARFYAYMYCMEQGIDSIGIMLSYCNVEQVGLNSLRIFERCFEAKELERFFYGIMEQYYVWVEMDEARKAARDVAIKAMPFPYEAYRRGQREFAVMAYKAIAARKNLFIEAPTGTGKTVSALFPSVKSLAEGLADKIFYLTAKTITRQAAESAVLLMEQSRVSAITLTAKDKICLLEKRSCNPRDCLYANGHFDRVNAAVWDIVTNRQIITRETVLLYAEKHTVCPHEFSLDIALWVDLIICDYNYAFDPKASLKRFFGDIPSGDFVLLIDEAHNLVERSREMFSATLYKKDFLEMKKAFKEKDKPLCKALGKINTLLLDVSKRIPPGKKAYISNELPEELYRLLLDFLEKADRWLLMPEATEEYDAFLELYFKALDFLRVSDCFDERYTVFAENGGGVVVKLLCLDPSHLLGAVLKKTAAAVFFSATLTPLAYFRDVLGGNTALDSSEGDGMARLPSPFDRDNLCVIVENRISTRYKDREGSYEKIADALFEMVCGKTGNYFAFFSSYEYLNRVYGIFTEKYGQTETLVQGQNMGETERERFLLEFDAGREASLLAFAVLGGIFSEGIDLTGERLIGAAVVGVGLPSVSDERDVIMEYYDKKMGSGFEFAYMYPGMNKVMQAAGRVIRTHTDRGVILLIDDRFVTGRYISLFPQNWADFKAMSVWRDYRELLEGFWGFKSTD